jgi:hypothetical protein
MTDPTTGGPTEEELRAYLESLRAAQPVEIVVQAFGILATASEVKLGRPDARVLIDGMTALLDATAAHLPPEIATRMRETISQLQTAQVQMEREAATAGAGAGPQDAGQTDAAAATETPAAQGDQESVTSKLWIPGR